MLSWNRHIMADLYCDDLRDVEHDVVNYKQAMLLAASHH